MSAGRSKQADSSKQWVELGKIVGVWGVQGWVKIHSYTRDRITIADYSEWWLRSQKKDSDSSNECYALEQCRYQGRGMVAKLANVDSRDAAEALIGRFIEVKIDDLPPLPEGEYYWQQLIGLTVFQKSGGVIGPVRSLLETGANDVLIVDYQMFDPSAENASSQQQVLIPYTDETVLEIDLDARRMVVNWDPDFLL